MQNMLDLLASLAAKGIKLSLEGDQLSCYAQQGVLTRELRDGIAMHRTQITQLLRQRLEIAGRAPAADPAPAPQPVQEFPLAGCGRGLYVLHQLDPASSAYNVPLCFRTSRAVQVPLLARAWAWVLQRHPILRARIAEVDGQPVYRIDEGGRSTLVERRVEIADDEAFAAHLQAQAERPFDLARGPLTRAELVVRPGRDTTLLLVLHHLVVDGVSSVILAQALFGSYQRLLQGGELPAEAPTLGYRDFVEWETALLASSDGRAHAAFWKRQLDGAPPGLELPPRCSAAPAAGGSSLRVQALAETTGRRVQELSRRHAVPPSAIFLAAWQLLLHRHCAQDDIVVVMPVMGRPEARFRQELGYFVNMVALRSRYAEGLSFTAWLRQAQGTMMDALYHSAYPFPLLVKDLQPAGARGEGAFRIAYAYQNVMRLQDAKLSDGRSLDLHMVEAVSQRGAHDLALEVFEDEGRFALHLKFAQAAFDDAMAGRLMSQLVTLLDGALREPEQALHAFPLVDEAERRRIVEGFNDTAAPFPQQRCVHEFFVERAGAAPCRPAVSFDGRGLSYGELHERCTHLALYLQSIGIGADSLVGLFMERSNELMVGLMGTLMAGGAYVPLDPDYPDERLRYMLEDTAARVLLTQRRLVPRLRELAGDEVELLALDDEWLLVDQLAEAAALSGAALQSRARPDSLAYVIYTSGSTGRPKGVMIEHRALMNRIHWMQRAYALGREDVVLQKTPYSFDVSVWEFVWPLMAGASVVFARPGGHMEVGYLRGLIDGAGVTTLHFVPSMLRNFLEHADGTCPTVRQVFCSGEALDWRSARYYRTRFPQALLHNLYGPTEAAIDVTFHDCSTLPDGFVPIGAPIDNTQIYILDPHLGVLPVGVPGELYIGGVGLARGYLNRDELTAERFVADPFRPGHRMYRTGDLARWMEQGEVQYLGRLDTQVKVRGLRIELGEIEVRLNEHPAVEDSAVVVQGRDEDKLLVAFYRAKGGAEVDARSLRQHLLERLPAYMVPAGFVAVDRIPLTPNGKVDRKALERRPLVKPAPAHETPAGQVQRRLAGLWEQLLGLPPGRVGGRDSFFALGGHSLLATQLLARMRTEFGVELALKVLFEHDELQAMAQAVQRAQQQGQRRLEPILPRRPQVQGQPQEVLPLSFAQERLWFIDQLEPGSAGYSCPGAVRIAGALDETALQRAFEHVIARHETLRTVFPSEQGRARQQVLAEQPLALQRHDLSALPDAAERDRQALALCRQEAAQPFDLARGPLLRALLIRLGPQEHVLMLNMHHIVSDGWSLGVLVGELGEAVQAYAQGRQPRLAALPIQYADYALWQRQWLKEDAEGGELQRQLAYWTGKLQGLPERLELPTDRPRPAVQDFRGAAVALKLPAALVGRLKALGEQQGCTLFMVLLAAFKTLLWRYSGQADLCVGSPIANRRHVETEGLIGMFVNTLALRTVLDEQDSLAALLPKVRATCLGAYEHQDMPFEKLVEALNPQRSMAAAPLFQVMLALHNTAPSGIEGPGLSVFPLEITSCKFDLSLDFVETAAGAEGTLEYATALFDGATARRMAAHFVALCEAAAAAPEAALAELPLLDQQEQHRLLLEFNDTRVPMEAPQCLHEAFAAQAARTPQRVALSGGGAEIRYGELHARVVALAQRLRARGVGPDRLVGVHMERSPELVVAVLAVLEAGGAYVPLDPEYPDERLAQMLADAAAPVVLTETALLPRLRSLLPPGCSALALDAGAADEPAAPAGAAAAHRPEQLAYVIFTSGSTGRPKGVMVEHRSLLNHNRCVRRRYGIAETDVQLQVSSMSFDLFAEEVFTVLLAGARLVFAPRQTLLAPQALAALIRDEGITLLNLPTAFFHRLVAAEVPLDGVRTVIVGGEKLEHGRASAFLARHPGARLVNTYGPTETTIISTLVDVTPELLARRAAVPIGAPIDNTQVHILDERMRLVPVGVPGELYIGGAGLARGYLGRPELTDERFVPSPWRTGARLYRTGDRARWLDDGQLEYLGRFDTQVKIRGFRIEPGEVEACLAAHPGVAACAVVARAQGDELRLVAFYSPRDTAVRADAESLRRHAAAALPPHLMPAAFVALDALPLTPNGKVDRLALERREIPAAPAGGRQRPREGHEARLAAIWAEVLGLDGDTLDLRDSFFALGGHSLLATQLLARMRTEFGVELALKALFEHDELQAMAQAVQQAQRQGQRRLEPIRPRERQAQEVLPLSFAQERLWFIDQLEPGSAGYSCPGAVRIAGALDEAALERAFGHVIARHETLRTVFPSEQGRARQQVLAEQPLVLQRHDLSALPDAAERERQALALCRQEAAQPFDLARGPLLRALLIRLAPQEHVLMLNMHHIVSDGWSLGVLVGELGEAVRAYSQGRQPRLAALPIQYADYALWQRQWLKEDAEGGELQRQLAYWTGKLQGLPERLELPTDRPRPAVQDFRGAAVALKLPAALVGRLKALGEQQGCTLFMVLLAAFKTLLWRYSGQADLCVGSPIANRRHVETEGLIGMFVNTLALRTVLDGQDSFAALLPKVRATCLGAYEHQDMPFEKLVEALNPQRSMAAAPLFQVMFVLQNGTAELPTGAIRPFDLPRETAKFDLTLEFTPEADGSLAGLLEYRTSLFDAPRMARVASHYGHLCAALSAAPDAPLAGLSYLGAEERTQLLGALSCAAPLSERPLPALDALPDLAAAGDAGRPAVVGTQGSLSYAGLAARSGALAAALRGRGVGPGRLVGLCLPRGLDLVVAIAAVLRSGAAYVPLDPEYPDERLAQMLGDAAATLLLAPRELRARLAPLAGATEVACLDEIELPAEYAAQEPVGTTGAEGARPAYVIFTSGSTGRPKGAAVHREGLANLLRWYLDALALSPADRVLVLTSTSFDLTQKNLLAPLLCGAAVHLAPEPFEPQALVATIRREAITVINLTPSTFQALMAADDGGALASLRHVVLGGEPIDAAQMAALALRYPALKVINSYGPTECADVCVWHTLNAQDLAEGLVPTGRPVPGAAIYLLDAGLQPVPLGVPGELYVGGVGVGLGYLNRDELTAERFTRDPFRPGHRMYRTGDLARWTEQGLVHYLGRIDNQVKLRGLRIELGEIEVRLDEHEAVADSVVVVQGRDADRRLVAFYRARDGQAVGAAALRQHLLARLPAYMVPAAFVALDRIPLTPNGKVDRRALEQRDIAPARPAQRQGPRDANESRMAAIWAEVLGLDAATLDIHDSFFALGGHSLLGVQLVARIAREFGRTLPVAALFAHDDIASLAAAAAGGTASASGILVPIQPQGAGAPLFAVPGAGGSVLLFAPLAHALRHLAADMGAEPMPFHGLQAQGLDGACEPVRGVERLAEARLLALREVQRCGPYRLVGHSFGGVVAFEMARQLLRRGECVESLVLIDSLAPAVMQAEADDGGVGLIEEIGATVARLHPGRAPVLDAQALRGAAAEERARRIVEALRAQDLDADEGQIAAFLRVFDADVASYRAYRPEPITQPLAVSLLRARESVAGRPAVPADAGWAALLERPPRVLQVEGGHLSMFDAGHAPGLAAALVEVLPGLLAPAAAAA